MTSDAADDTLFEVEPSAVSARTAQLLPAGKSKTFRHYDQAQGYLLPPSLDDWLPQGHTARFISEVVEEMLDLTPVYARYEKRDGAPPYDPRLMLKLVLYGYSTGVTSSREIERRCHVDVAFRWLAANEAPDYRSISRFRRLQLPVMEQLFTQGLQLCAEAGLVKLGRVALDGTKLRASASRHKAMSHDRLGPRIEELKRQVRDMLAEAEAMDQAEDEEFGADQRGDELPKELATREGRLAKLRAAKKAIEEEARTKAAEKAGTKARESGSDEEAVKLAETRAHKTATPEPKAQRNFTDPEARIMKTNEGFQYAYNAQAVTDEKSQVVIAVAVTQQATDVQQWEPMVTAAEAQLTAAGIAEKPRLWLADAGYYSDDNVKAAEQHDIDALIATGRLGHGEKPSLAPRGRIPAAASRRDRMARRLRTKKGRADYARRKAIAEPPFGQMKVRQAAGRLRLRGLAGATGEWNLHTLCHNLRKLSNYRARPMPSWA
jgi:transposase